MAVLIISLENKIYPTDFAQLTDLMFEGCFLDGQGMWGLKEEK